MMVARVETVVVQPYVIVGIIRYSDAVDGRNLRR